MNTFKYSFIKSLGVFLRFFVWYLFLAIPSLVVYFESDKNLGMLVPLYIFTIFYLVIPLSFHISYYIEDKEKEIMIDTEKKEIIYIKREEQSSISFDDIKCIEEYLNKGFLTNWNTCYFYYKIVPKNEESKPIVFTSLLIRKMEKKFPILEYKKVFKGLPYVPKDI